MFLFYSCDNGEDVLVDSQTADTEILVKNSSPLLANRGAIIIFGRYYGKCQGNECVEVFRLIESILLVDAYPASGGLYQGDFTSFKSSGKVVTTGIFPNFPKELLNSKRTVFGTPDVGDRGGFI